MIMKNKGLLATMVLLGAALVLISVQFYFQTIIDGVNDLSPRVALGVINGVIFVIILVLFIFTRRMFVSAKQERILQVQERYIAHLRDLIKVIRVQRHDFVNHLQAVYALLKTDETEKARHYIENIYADIKITSETLRINIPEVSALLLVKTGIAAARNINFLMEVEAGFEKIRLNPLEINTVVGNLIDNAFDAVTQLNSKEREVIFKLFETPQKWVIQVHNNGHIPEEIKDKIFIPGFSTKEESENRGYGLASLKSVVEKNHGEILVSSRPSWGTRFTVIFPKD